MAIIKVSLRVDEDVWNDLKKSAKMKGFTTRTPYLWKEFKRLIKKDLK